MITKGERTKAIARAGRLEIQATVNRTEACRWCFLRSLTPRDWPEINECGNAKETEKEYKAKRKEERGMQRAEEEKG